MNNFYFLNILLSIQTFCLFYPHLLVTLIILEYMMINTIYLTYFTLLNLGMSNLFIMFILTLMISEGIIGLTILVYMIRLTGNDYTLLMNMLKW